MRWILSRSPIIWLTVAIAVSSCRHSPAVNWQHPSPNQDSRVQFLVIHATEIDFAKSLHTLTRADVSSHYLVDRDGTIYGLVPESRRAWHAGPSFWQGATPLNPSSIGIEIVSVAPGLAEGSESGFPPTQILAVTDLIADIVKRHGIRPDRIVGHGEVQPDTRSDPGRLFPWAALQARGLVPMADPATLEQYRIKFSSQGLPDVRWVQERLSQHGYQITCNGALDEHTRRVISVFQGRYRQQSISGEPDLETVSLLAALTDDRGLKLQVPDGRTRSYRADPPLQSHCASP
jgi:N-acetylmuramoyl-L-alanine amidase